jgi:hypothetical protein
MSSNSDFYPRRDAERMLWLQNLRSKIEGHSKTLGLSASRVKEITGRLDTLIESFAAKARAAATYQAAVAAHNELEERTVAELRADVREIKANRLCSDGMKADLQIMGGGGESAARGEARPDLSAEVHTGFVRIRFKKRGFDGVNVYTRRPGEPVWRFLARDTNSPYDDHSELEKPGTPEVREYRLVGVEKDQEASEPSDAVSVTFAG